MRMQKSFPNIGKSMKRGCRVLPLALFFIFFMTWYVFEYITTIPNVKTYQQLDTSRAVDYMTKDNNISYNRLEEDRKRTNGNDGDVKEINIVFIFTNVKDNPGLKKRFSITMSSLMQFATVPLAIHIIADPENSQIANNIVQNYSKGRLHRVVNIDIKKVTKDLYDIVHPLMKYFTVTHGRDKYFHNTLFFLAVGIHKVMPESMKHLIMLDVDLKFQADIKQLYEHFNLFKKDNVMGIGSEMHPAYLVPILKYMRKYPSRPVNDFMGFNSGVLLFNLEQMRNSKLYNKVIQKDFVKELAADFDYQGHLGDQDLYSLLNIVYPQLFYTLPCQWNRQLCKLWWAEMYNDLFYLFNNCSGPIKIYHGNCKTPIPY